MIASKETISEKEEIIVASIPDAVVIQSEKVESQPNRNSRKSASEKISHIVQEGETLKSISKLYDLDETKLRLRNRLPKDAVVAAGESLHLRKKISVFNRPEFTREATASNSRHDDEFIF